jgi:plasmid stabilization system protein ParE
LARVELAEAAVEDLERLIHTHSLPPDTKERVRRSLRSLESFPLIGAPLVGRWEGFRFLLGPWRWMVIVYEYLEEEQRIVVTTIQDGRASSSPTHSVPAQ